MPHLEARKEAADAAPSLFLSASKWRGAVHNSSTSRAPRRSFSAAAGLVVKPTTPESVSQCLASKKEHLTKGLPAKLPTQALRNRTTLPAKPPSPASVGSKVQENIPQQTRQRLQARRASEAKATQISSVELRVHTLAGLLCTVQAELSWDLSKITKAIEAESEIPADEQILLRGADALASQSPLTHMTAVCDLTLVRRVIQERAPSPAHSDRSRGSSYANSFWSHMS